MFRSRIITTQKKTNRFSFREKSTYQHNEYKQQQADNSSNALSVETIPISIAVHSESNQLDG